VDYAKFVGNVGTDSIFGHSKTLLANLVNLRKGDNTENRPIIFVGHSLGGIVVKDMLIVSSGRKEHKSIFLLTKAIMFMGTPHRGAASAETLSDSLPTTS
jgi:triacylglycerol esterase/lipase EstA (alpha/beta hydrolase family)